MKRFSFICGLALILSLFFMRCHGYEHETIPNVRVNFTIYPDNVNYYLDCLSKIYGELQSN